jgi:hypothetical protein
VRTELKTRFSGPVKISDIMDRGKIRGVWLLEAASLAGDLTYVLVEEDFEYWCFVPPPSSSMA